MTQSALYAYYLEKLSQYPPAKVKRLLSEEKKKHGWTSGRAVFLVALKRVASNKHLS